MVNTEKSPYSKRLLKLISWGHWFTFFNIGAAILIAFIFLDAEGVPATGLSKAYMLTTWVSHMAFLTFVAYLLTVFPLTLLYPVTRVIRGIASLIFTVVLSLLLLDGFTYHQLGYHLNLDASSQIIDLVSARLSDTEIPFAAIGFASVIAILAFELLVSNYAWKHLRELQQRMFPKFVIGIILICFVFSHVTHIYADAKLDYNVLRQDNMLPMSYPATAKTLLTKYGLFDINDYQERRNSPYRLTQSAPTYPTLSAQCAANPAKNHSVFVILSDKGLSTTQIERFNSSSAIKGSPLLNHIDNATEHDAWFNLMFSLPTIYQDDMRKQNATPMLFQQMAASEVTASLSIISDEQNDELVPSWLQQHFNRVEQHKDISRFVYADKLNGLEQGLHLFYFKATSDYQFELFINALLLAQQQKAQKDVVWIASLGDNQELNAISIKPSLLIWPNKQGQAITRVTSNMDMQTTLMRYWFDCGQDYKSYGNGVNVYRVRDDRVFANTTSDGLIVVKKDKNILVDQQGNFTSYSTTLDTVISEESDLPMLIDGVNQLNLFSQKNNPTEQ
ncbi:DUF3413 domain-containing protein [Thalassotalea maritima]|uniref:DUF3413 domain-containing protein n=1 Tax=Thalassotalea maritima TaxID=3242416 RepID=UPI0035298406